MVIHYIGPGRKNTGDWCFEDGFIEFKDIKDAYMQYFFNKNPKYASKCLEVTADCSYSGKWVLDCRDFLNKFGVQPCGHSAWEANIFLKVRASCRSHQVPHSLLYSARGSDIITGMYNIMDLGKYEIGQNQHVINIDSTFISCKKGVAYEDPCSLPDDYNWHKKSEEERVYLVRGFCGDDNKAAWWYVLIVDDEEIIELFLKKVTGRLNLGDYGQVLGSGLGQDPPDEIREMIMKKYSPVAKNIREL